MASLAAIGITAGVVVAIAMSCEAQATPLVQADLFVAGDGKITRDPITGLEWLDLTETFALSINDVLDGAGPTGGWISGLGFRYATIAEVETLFVNHGFPDINSPTAANVPFFESFLFLFNTPCSTAPSVVPRVPVSCSPVSFGFTGSIAEPVTLSSPERFALSDVRFFPLGGADSSAPCCTPVAWPRTVGINQTASFKNEGSDVIGHWLIRTTEVSEPSTVALFAAGLLGLVSGYRNRRRRPRITVQQSIGQEAQEDAKWNGLRVRAFEQLRPVCLCPPYPYLRCGVEGNRANTDPCRQVINDLDGPLRHTV